MLAAHRVDIRSLLSLSVEEHSFLRDQGLSIFFPGVIKVMHNIRVVFFVSFGFIGFHLHELI